LTSERMKKMMQVCMTGIGAESIREVVADMDGKILDITDDDEVTLYVPR